MGRVTGQAVPIPGVARKDVQEPVVTAQLQGYPGGAALQLVLLGEAHQLGPAPELQQAAQLIQLQKCTL